MSVASPETSVVDVVERPARLGRARSRLRRFGRALAAVSRFAFGVVLCFHPLTAIIAVGWVFRLMRRNLWRGWWVAAGNDRSDFAEFEPPVPIPGGGFPVGVVPRWLAVERAREHIRRPLSDGREPSRFRRLARVPGAWLGGLWANVREGIRAVACTYVLTLPGCFLWLAAWYDGWNNSFTKGYEQAAVGPLTGVLGSVLFIAAMVYVPMAWAHLAATGRAWAFFQFSLVWSLIRRRLGSVVLFAAAFSLLTLPVSVLRAAPAFFTNIDPTLESATPERIRQVANTYILLGGAYMLLAFLIVHLLAGRMYRVALLGLLRAEPRRADELPPDLRAGLAQLGLIPEGPPGRRHPLVAVVVGTGRTTVRVALWAGLLVLWFTVVAQIFVGEFLNHHPVAGWLNQPLIHLPSIHFTPGGI